jgi:hypothetical protein
LIENPASRNSGAATFANKARIKSGRDIQPPIFKSHDSNIAPGSARHVNAMRLVCAGHIIDDCAGSDSRPRHDPNRIGHFSSQELTAQTIGCQDHCGDDLLFNVV